MGYIALGSQTALTDHQGTAQSHLDELLPLEWVIPQPHAYAGLWSNTLAAPNYSTPKQLKPNQAYWPTGATRWGYGYLLMTGTAVDQLVPETAVSLDVNTPSYSLVTKVYPLQGRQLTHNPTGEANLGLWIVPFVDRRYYWQYQDVQLTVKNATTWGEIFAELQAVTTDLTFPEVNAAWMQPSQFLGSRVFNFAVVLDAICLGLGLRIVRKWDDTIEAQDTSAASSAITVNLSKDQSHAVTGLTEKSASRPAELHLVSDVALTGMRCPSKPQHISTYTTTGKHRIVSTPATAYEILSTCAANWITTTPDPANKTALDGLAAVLGAAFEEWRDRVYDHAWTKIQDWQPTGFDDFVWHQFGVELMDYEADHPDPEQSAKIKKVWRCHASTRAVSYSEQFAYPRNYSTDQDYVAKDDAVLIRVSADLLPGGSASGKIVHWNGTSWTESDTVELLDYDPNATGRTEFGATCALTNEVIWGQTYRNADSPDIITSCRPLSAHSHGLTRVISPSTGISVGGTGPANIMRAYGAPGPAITVRNYTNKTMVAGRNYGAIWVATAKEWAVVTGAEGEQQPVEAPRMLEFTLDSGLALGDLNAPATVTQVWNGATPASPITVNNTCNQFQGPAQTCGVAREDDITGEWNIIVLWDRIARFIEFTTTGLFTKANPTIPATTDFWYDGVDPGQPVIYNTGGLFKGETTQLKGTARYDFNRARYQAIYVDVQVPEEVTVPQVITFSTRDPFAIGDANVLADVTAWSEGPNPDPGGAGVTIENTCNAFFAEAGQTCGIARWSANLNAGAGGWMMVNIWEQRTRFVFFTTDGDFEKGVNSFPATVVESWDGAGAAAGITVQNTGNMFESPGSGHPGIARWDYRDDPKLGDGEYQCVYMPPKPETQATLIKFTSNTAVAFGDDTFVATLTQRLNGSVPPDGAIDITIRNTCNQFMAEAANTCGMAVWNSTTSQYDCVLLQETRTRFIHFTTAQPVETTTSPFNATIQNTWDGEGAAGVVPVYNTGNLFEAPTGTHGIARWDYANDPKLITGKYQCVYLPPKPEDTSRAKTIKFTTNAAVALADNTFLATLTERFNGTVPADGTNDLQIRNAANQFFCRAAGTEGVAVWDENQSEYECIVLWDRDARFIEVQTLAAFSKTSPSVSCTLLNYYDGVNPGTPVTVWNTSGLFEGGVGTAGLARYDFGRDRFQAVYFPPPPQAPPDVPQFIEFSTQAPFALTDNTVMANVSAWWEGSNPDPLGNGVTLINTCNEFFAETSGTCGMARWSANANAGAGGWQIVNIYEQRTRFIWFETTGPVSKNDASWPSTVIESMDGNGAGATAAIWNVGNTFHTDSSGTPGLARWSYPDDPKTKTGRYVCVYMPPPDEEEDPQSTHIKFTANAAVNLSTNTFLATVTERFNGEQPLVGANNILVRNTCNQFRSEAAGACGLAVWDKAGNEYECLVLYEQRARFVEFTSNTAFTKGTTAFSATRQAFYDGVDPGLTLTIYNTQAMFEGSTSTPGVARWDYERGRYQAVFIEGADQQVDIPQMIQFATKAPFAIADAQVEVNVTEYWEGSDPDPGGVGLFVQNTCNNHFAEVTGRCGVARWSERLGQWQIIDTWEQRTRFFEFRTTGPFGKTDGTFFATVQDAWDGEGVSGVQEIVNTGLMFKADSANTPGIARWDYADDPKVKAGRYMAVYVEPPDQEESDQAAFIKFTTNTAVTLTQTSFIVTLTERFNGTIPPNGANNIAVQNTAQQFQAAGAGARGLAVWNGNSATYECLVLEDRRARFIECTSNTSFSKASTFVGATVQAFWDGISPGATVTLYNTQQMFEGSASTPIIARWDWQRGRYQMVYAPQDVAEDPQAQHIDFSVVTAGGFSYTTSTFLGQVTAIYNGSTPIVGSNQTIRNTNNAFFAAAAGELGSAAWDSVLGQYKVVSMRERRARFVEWEASTAFTKLSTSWPATRDAFYDGVDPGPSLTIWNSGQNFEGSSQTKGLARWDYERERYQCVYAPPQLTQEPVVEWMEFETTGAFTTTTSPVTVTRINWWNGDDPAPNPPHQLSILNVGEVFYSAGEGQWGVAAKSARDGQWRIVQLKCVAQ